MHSVTKFRQLAGSRKRLLCEAALLLPAAWFLVRALPFRWWSNRLGISVPGEADPVQTAYDARARDIAWALKAINRRVGDRFTCLMLAMAAQWMLNRRGIASSVVLGTCNELNDRQELAFKAHAWLRVGNHIVLGQHDGRFTAVTSFIKTPRHTNTRHST